MRQTCWLAFTDSWQDVRDVLKSISCILKLDSEEEQRKVVNVLEDMP